MKVLFICHANICRSFMAQELLKKWRPDLEVFSRGLYADPGYSVPETVYSFLADYQIPRFPHTSTQLSATDMETADLVLLMEQQQIDQVLDAFAQHTDKCYLLLDYAYGEEKDLADPIALTGKAFRTQAGLLHDAVEICAKKIPR